MRSLCVLMGRDYVWDKLEFKKKASLPIKRLCVCARVHKIKVHTNLLTLATVRSRRIEVEVSFHTFKKKNFYNHVSCKTLLRSPTIPRLQASRRARASSPILSTQAGGQPSSLRLAPSHLSLRRLGL